MFLSSLEYLQFMFVFYKGGVEEYEHEENGCDILRMSVQRKNLFMEDFYGKWSSNTYKLRIRNCRHISMHLAGLFYLATVPSCRYEGRLKAYFIMLFLNFIAIGGNIVRKRLIFPVAVILFLSFFSTANAGDIPLCYKSSRTIAALLNSPEVQSKLPKNYATLSPVNFLKYDKGMSYYVAYADGGNADNGVFMFTEDSRGNLYDIMFVYKKDDMKMLEKCTRIMVFYFTCMGVDTEIINHIFKNITYKNKYVAGNQIWVSALNGFLTFVAGISPDYQNSVLVGFSLSSRKF